VAQWQARLDHDATGDGVGGEALGRELGGQLTRCRAGDEDVVAITRARGIGRRGRYRTTATGRVRFADSVVLLAQSGGHRLRGRQLLVVYSMDSVRTV